MRVTDNVLPAQRMDQILHLMQIVKIESRAVQFQDCTISFLLHAYTHLVASNGKSHITGNVIRREHLSAHRHRDDVLLIISLLPSHQVNETRLQYDDIIGPERVIYRCRDIAQT